MNYGSLIRSMTEEQKDRILSDLFICIQNGRLRDSPNGWTGDGAGCMPIPLRNPFANYRIEWGSLDGLGVLT